MKIKETKLHKNNDPASVAAFCLLIAWTALLFSLLIWGFLSSLKNRPEFSGFGRYDKTSPLALPEKWLWSNYKDAFRMIAVPVGSYEVLFGEMMVNSVIYAVGCTFFSTVSPMLAAYACAKYDFKFGKLLYMVVLTVLVIPIVGNQASELQMSRLLGLYDNFPGVFFMRAGFTNMYFLIFYEAFKGQSNTYAEAARIDGAGDFTVFFRIAIPLAVPVIVGVAILVFIDAWNNYTVSLIYLPSHPVVTLGLFYMQSNTATNMTVPILIAGAYIVCIPTLVLFVAFRNKIMGNLSIGGIKE